MEIFRKPKVLLIGNGLNRCFGCDDWCKWVDDLAKVHWGQDVAKWKQNDGKLVWDESMPMPLRAILASKDHVDEAMDEKFGVKKEGENEKGKRRKITPTSAFGKLDNNGHRGMLQSLLGAGFDHILTTNYSYELELAAWESEGNLINKLKRNQRHTPYVKQAESKYNMYTYQQVNWQGVENRIWHIHGEARKPGGTIFGQYYYAQILHRMLKYSEYTRNVYKKRQGADKRISTYSWQDAFLIGDVYILGFSMGFSEVDLWYLINRKQRENADHGRVIFFEPKASPSSETAWQKLELLKLFDVEVKHMGIHLSDDEGERKKQFHSFYHEAIQFIVDDMKEVQDDIRECILIPPEKSDVPKKQESGRE